METLRLIVAPGSPARARAFVARLLRLWGYDRRMVEEATLMVSELATNAVIHVGEPFWVEVDEVDQGVRVAVKDPSPVLPVIQAPGPQAESGRGLRIVQTLAAEWGALALDGGGKAVWFITSPSA